jgi:hypothetical protein
MMNRVSGMAIDQRGARVQVAPAQEVDRKVVANGCAQDPVEARIVWLALRLLRQDDPDADRARRILPVGDDIGHRRIVRVDRLDDGEPAGMGPLHVHRIAGVVAVHGKGGDEDRAVDADLVHCRHHLVTRDVIGPVRHCVPGSLWGVRLIGMDLRIDNRHWESPLPSELVSQVRLGIAWHAISTTFGVSGASPSDALVLPLNRLQECLHLRGRPQMVNALGC